MTYSPIFSKDVEVVTEIAKMASDMRILGFNERTIRKYLDSIEEFEQIESIKKLIKKYKNMCDVYGDAQE